MDRQAIKLALTRLSGNKPFWCVCVCTCVYPYLANAAKKKLTPSLCSIRMCISLCSPLLHFWLLSIPGKLCYDPLLHHVFLAISFSKNALSLLPRSSLCTLYRFSIWFIVDLASKSIVCIVSRAQQLLWTSAVIIQFLDSFGKRWYSQF